MVVLGILSLIGCGLFTGLPAWILGRGDLKEMDAGQRDPLGRDSTKIGMILGIIGTALSLIGFVIFFLVAILGGLGAFMGIKSQ